MKLDESEVRAIQATQRFLAPGQSSEAAPLFTLLKLSATSRLEVDCDFRRRQLFNPTMYNKDLVQLIDQDTLSRLGCVVSVDLTLPNFLLTVDRRRYKLSASEAIEVLQFFADTFQTINVEEPKGGIEDPESIECIAALADWCRQERKTLVAISRTNGSAQEAVCLIVDRLDERPRQRADD